MSSEVKSMAGQAESVDLDSGREEVKEEDNALLREEPAVPEGGTPGGGARSLPESMGCWGKRHSIALLGSAGLMVSITTRVNLSLAVVAMVSPPPLPPANTSLADVCPPPPDHQQQDAAPEGEFDWSEKTQGEILAAFYWGYAVVNLVGGELAARLGGKRVFCFGVLLTSFLSLLSPVCVRTSKNLFFGLRVIQGAAQGVMFPAIGTLQAAWAPAKEKGIFSTVILLGFQLGMVIGLCLGGWLCNSGLFGGWPSVFYVFGAAGLIWSIPWVLLVHEHPDQHPSISKEELAYIQSDKRAVKQAKRVPVPWLAVAQSWVVWGVITMSWANNYCIATFATSIPSYLSNLLHFEIKSNGMGSALPYLVSLVLNIFWGGLMNRLTLSGRVTILTVRRLTTALATYVPAAALVGMCFAGCNSSLALTLLCVAIGMNGIIGCGYLCTVHDIAPNLAGTLSGIAKGVGTFSGILSPMLSGYLLQDNQTLSGWRTVFLVPAAALSVAATLYLLVVTDQLMSWSEPKTEKTNKSCSERDEGQEKNDAIDLI